MKTKNNIQLEKYKRKTKIKRNIQSILIFIGILSFFSPLIWLILGSFKPESELLSVPPTILPRNFTLENYRNVLKDTAFLRSYLNTFIVAGLSILVMVPASCLVAYAFARLRFRGKNILLLTVLLTQLLPPMILLIPYFLFFQQLHLVGSLRGLIIIYIGFFTPLLIWLLRSFFLSIPIELEESAILDGCSRFRVIYKIVLPLSAPGVITSAIFAFLLCWNEYLFALVLTNYQTATLSVKIAGYIGARYLYIAEMIAAGVLGIIPPVLLVVFAQHWLIKGLTEGGVKG